MSERDAMAMTRATTASNRHGAHGSWCSSRISGSSSFFLVPFLIVLKISLSQTAIAQPPYVPVLDLAAGWQGVQAISSPALSFENYALLGSDWLYLTSYLKQPRRSRRSRRCSCC